jgi:hypothetical protein
MTTMSTKLPEIHSLSSPSNLLRSDWNFSSVADNARMSIRNNQELIPFETSKQKSSSVQMDNRPGSKERYGNNKKKGLPPVYSKWLLKYWLYSNRTQTCPVDHVNLAGWPMNKTVAGCVSTICKRSLSLKLTKSVGVFYYLQKHPSKNSIPSDPLFLFSYFFIIIGVNDQILNRLSFLSKIILLDVSGCNEITDVGTIHC